MTIASVTTDINFGPYKIPSNAQNMIMNNFAQRNNLSVEVVIPEPIMSNQLATTMWLHEEFNFKQIILSSIYQLPKNKNLEKLINKMNDVQFNFAIEGLRGKGNEFINCVSEEALIFEQSTIIETVNTTWTQLNQEFLKKLKKKI